MSFDYQSVIHFYVILAIFIIVCNIAVHMMIARLRRAKQKKCSGCRHGLTGDEKFCPNCGQNLALVEEVSENNEKRG